MVAKPQSPDFESLQSFRPTTYRLCQDAQGVGDNAVFDQILHDGRLVGTVGKITCVASS
jgi:hypothetical protein